MSGIKKKKFKINGKDFICSLNEPFLYDLLKTFLKEKVTENHKIAVAVNNVLVEKKKWKKKKIFYDDKIEIVTPFFGG